MAHTSFPLIPGSGIGLRIGEGIGLTDAQLIASCLATPGTQIWTIDGPLGRVTVSLGIRTKLP